MLVHLSKTSPYVCDISLGPIEQANRMALAPTKRMLPFLEMKESFPKQTRTPLKLLAAEEIPLESTSPAASREPSLQPVWYTEQTIVDEQHPVEKETSTLPTIESESPTAATAEEEDEQPLPNQPSLMRKSSTFTLEPQASLDLGDQMNDSEKENDSNIITSTQTDPTHRPAAPSDESFRALEHLLGLGSTNINMTMTTTAQESPKSNHDTLSLTIVTPTELINNTTTASLHVSYAPAGGSLPSSQNVLLMPTIESITEPSINSTIPPPFSVDSSVEEEPSSTGGTLLNHENFNATEDSFRFSATDDDEEEEKDTETSQDDDNNFSFELNDFPNDSPTNETVPVPEPPATNIRPPTSADVAYRALIKPRPAARVSQPVKAISPLASPNRVKVTVRQSVPVRVLRSSTRRVSIKVPEEEPPVPSTKLIEMVTLPEEESTAEGNVTLNLTTTTTTSNETNSSSVEDAEPVLTPIQPVLSREFTFNTPTLRSTRASERRRSMMKDEKSLPTRSTRSCLPSIPIQPEPISEEEQESPPPPSSSSSSDQTLLSVVSTNVTTTSEAPMIILQKSLAGSASPSPNPTPVLSVQGRESLSSPRRSINPLHSSTPSSMRKQSLQFVSIGEEEQVSTTVPPTQLNIETSMIDEEQQVDLRPLTNTESIQTSPIRPPARREIAIQTSPMVSPRQCHTMEQQTSPPKCRTFSCQTSPIEENRSPPVPIEIQPEPPVQTPIHSKAVIQLRRNVRFQFTPSTDARLAAKEKLEEEQLKFKREIPIDHPEEISAPPAPPEQPLILLGSDQEREEDTEDELQKPTKTSSKKKKTKKSSASKKKKMSSTSTTKTEESSEETMESPVLLPMPIQEEPVLPPQKKRSARLEKKPSPTPMESEPIKRPNRKRPNPKTSSSQPPSENTSPTEPVVKKVKTEVPSTRSRSKTKKTSPTENPAPPPAPALITTTTTTTTTKRKTNTISSGKKGKRRLHSVEQDEGLNTADEEEAMVIPPPPPPPVVEVEEQEELTLPQEDREKIEALTVAELKNRLTTHGENIPKGARKAELVALMMKIELQLLKKRTEAVPDVLPTTRKTRRKK